MPKKMLLPKSFITLNLFSLEQRCLLVIPPLPQWMLSSSECPFTPSGLENSGSNFRLPFHPHYCPNLWWLHYLFRGTIQQPNLTFLDSPSQIPMPFTPGHLFPGVCDQTVPLTTNSISGYNFLFFQPSHASLPQHRFFNVTETPPPSPIQFLYPPMFSYAIKLFPSQSGSHAWSSEPCP